jgi:hypothetical protein
MDPRVVDAMRAVRALEDGEQLDDEGYLVEEGDDQEEEADGRQAKRQRMEIEDVPESEQPQQQQPPSLSNGLLSADTLESLKYFAEIRQKNGSAPSAPPTKPVAAPVGLGLADYGSDDE